MLVDSSICGFFMIDGKRKEIIKVSTEEVDGTVEVGTLNVSLNPRGGGENIAGYATDRFDLIANSELSGSTASRKSVKYAG
jgi:hypothetical protein